MERKVPGSNDERHSIGLGVDIGPVQEGQHVLLHRYVLCPGLDVPGDTGAAEFFLPHLSHPAYIPACTGPKSIVDFKT